MRKLVGRPAPIALLAEGPTRPELLVSLPALARRIGPVIAGSYQQASRVANALRHGTPARGREPLRDARVVICAGAAAAMAEILGEIERKWRGAVVIFAGPPENDPAPKLSRQGAHVATATLLPGPARKPCCLVSGSAEATKLLRDCGAKVVTAPMGSAADFRVGIALIENGLPQLLQAASESLLRAGIATQDMREILDTHAGNVTRVFLRTRRKPVVGAEIKSLLARVRSGSAVP